MASIFEDLLYQIMFDLYRTWGEGDHSMGIIAVIITNYKILTAVFLTEQWRIYAIPECFDVCVFWVFLLSSLKMAELFMECEEEELEPWQKRVREVEEDDEDDDDDEPIFVGEISSSKPATTCKTTLFHILKQIFQDIES